MANMFNEFFVNIGTQISNSLPKAKQNFESYLPEEKKGRFNFRKMGALEVEGIIKGQKNKNSAGFDRISNNILKLVNPHTSKVLTEVINTSLETGIVPDRWKVARVIPLFKSGKENDINNYRPISLLPVFSKILLCGGNVKRKDLQTAPVLT